MREAVLAERLNAEGRPSRTGKPWAPETVRQIANRAMPTRAAQRHEISPAASPLLPQANIYQTRWRREGVNIYFYREKESWRADSNRGPADYEAVRVGFHQGPWTS
jgi:hypothetical protein